jgi:hypothetical protein
MVTLYLLSAKGHVMLRAGHELHCLMAFPEVSWAVHVGQCYFTEDMADKFETPTYMCTLHLTLHFV